MLLPDRKPTRHPSIDYTSPNCYFVTICTHEKKCIFGTTSKLSVFGRIAEQAIKDIPGHYPEVSIDAYVVMPNHVHAIVSLKRENGVHLAKVIGDYKSGVTRKIHRISKETVVWQRSFHDHVIRTPESHEKIWSYVVHNRQKWDADCFYVAGD